MLKLSKSLALIFFVFFLYAAPVLAATSIPFTITLSKAVNVTGTPRIALDVGGIAPPRYATYTSGSGTSTLTFTYTMVAGDVDLDGVTLTASIDLNGGTIKDLVGNDLSPLTFTAPNTTNVKVNYPSLGMDFVYDSDGRYTLNGLVYNDLTTFLSAASGSFTRASVGTYFDSAGVLQTAASGVPRFDYDPTTHVAKGILIEESRTNLLIQSNSFTTSPWDTTACGGVSNSGSTTIAPNGASTPIYDFSTTACLYQDISITNGNTYTHSIWIKANQSGIIGFRNPGSSSFTSTNITVGTTWQRYTITATADQAFSRFLIDNRAASGYGISGLKLSLFGAQLEQGAFATSYISTTTAAATRAADVLTIPTGSWYNSTEGSFYSSVNPGSNTANETWVSFLRGNLSTDSQFIFREGGNLNAFSLTTSGTGGRIAGSVAYASAAKAALGYKNADMGYSVNGNITTSTYNMPVGLNSLRIGAFSTGNRYLNGWEKSFKYYPLRVSNAQLQLMTQ